MRLERNSNSVTRKRREIFQFHKGAIRTNKSGFSFTAPTLFQFHKGAIRTKPRFVTLLSVNNFNSIKVRLEHRSV